LTPLLFAIGLSLVACAEPPNTPEPPPKRMTNPPIVDGEYVRAEGLGLALGERPFRFIGGNAALIHGAAAREGLPALLDAMKDDGISVIRVWAAGEADDDGRDWRRAYAFRLGPEAWVETSFEHLDRLLVEARERDIRVMIALSNRWGDYGGLPQYARWTGITPRRKNLLPAELLAVLSSDAARDLYRAHVVRVVGRVNSISGTPYREDPTIFSWELANELSAQTCESDDALFDWTRTMARYVRSLDSQHLIGAGHIGYKTELSRRSWERITALEDIDYADVHAYPHNVLAITDMEALDGWLDERAHLALNVVDKPLIVGEIGFPRNHPTHTPREDWFARTLERADADGVSGVMVWIYRSWDERDDPQGIWAEGPRADETAPVRAALRWAAVSWAGTSAAVANPTVLNASEDDVLFPLGLEHLRPWVESEWQASGDDAGRLSLDPWALAEGCANDDSPAFAQYVVEAPRDETPASLRITALGPPVRARREDHGIEVLVDGVHVGTWNGPGRFSPAEEGALEAAFGARHPFHLVTVRSAVESGRAHIRRLLVELPGEGTLEMELEYAEGGDP
jgi:mannan endo-1,4-beta-mannosidase